MIYKLIETLLKDKTGLHSASIGSEAIKANVKRRMDVLSIADVSAYYTLLNQSPEELQELINETMVPETWFFRDDTPFQFLKSFINNKWLASGKKSKLRIINIPCATGEEPYSVAMTLLECGMKPEQFIIDGVDINTWVLSYAAKANYSKYSFRGKVIHQHKHYFEKIADRYQLKESVKKSVSFNYGNILDDDFIRKSGCYNIVFCRNLLIYFDEETKRKVVSNLYRLLSDDGVLFVGYADVSSFVNQSFRPVSFPGAFAFYKQSQVEPGAGASFVQQPPSNELYKKSFESLIKAEIVNSEEDVDNDPFAEEGVTRRIQELADKGELDKAKRLCQELLKKNAVSVDAHYLMGVILDVKGMWSDAHSLFCKTLYLDPKHYEALTYLAIYAERRGDTSAAKVYRSRAARVAEQKMSSVS